MTENNTRNIHSPAQDLPFPPEWITSDPLKVEDILATLSIEEQARYVMRLKGKRQMDCLLLSVVAQDVTRALPPEEVYQMVKEIGENDASPILSMASEPQLQYIFDIEWWQGDKFQPKRALHWLTLLNVCDESQIINWFLNEETNQTVTLMQSLVKVFKRDEMTDSYEGVEGMEHFTPDGVYDIFFIVKDMRPLKKLFLELRLRDENFFNSLLEAVIWYPLTPTLENAYRWRMTRTAERGIPEFEEAMEIYSRLEAEDLNLDPSSADEFPVDEEFNLSPRYPLMETDPESFFAQCVNQLNSGKKLDAIRWESVFLANKIMVADGMDPSNLEGRREAIRKALGYVNIGLELGAEGDPEKGGKLLSRTRLQFLFQVGYGHLMQLKWKTEKLLSDQGEFLEFLVAPSDKERLQGLIGRFPMMSEYMGEEEPVEWRNLETLLDTRMVETYLDRWAFFARFAKQGLDLNLRKMEQFAEACDFPETKESFDIIIWSATALARFVLFKEIDCRPLFEAAAVNFMELIFLPGIYQDEPKAVDDQLVEEFRNKLLETPMAWSDDDKKFLLELLQECVDHLREQLGSLNPKEPIDWRYARGLCIQSQIDFPEA